jgi:hypothetical protein
MKRLILMGLILLLATMLVCMTIIGAAAKTTDTGLTTLTPVYGARPAGTSAPPPSTIIAIRHDGISVPQDVGYLQAMTTPTTDGTYTYISTTTYTWTTTPAITQWRIMKGAGTEAEVYVATSSMVEEITSSGQAQVARQADQGTCIHPTAVALKDPVGHQDEHQVAIAIADHAYQRGIVEYTARSAPLVGMSGAFQIEQQLASHQTTTEAATQYTQFKPVKTINQITGAQSHATTQADPGGAMHTLTAQIRGA